MKYEWTERSVCYYYNEQQTGKIVGTLAKMGMADNTWIARINGDYLGEYISELQGKKAIEKKVKQIDDETEIIRKTMPKAILKKAQEK